MKRVFIFIALASSLAGLILCSLRLAGTRAYRADECTETSAAMASGINTSAAPPLTLFQLALSGVVRGATSAPDALVAGRLLMLIVFWLNWILLASATGARLLSARWLVALAAAATLAPLWNFGFEIRPDDLVLAGVLFAWSIVRFNPPGKASFFLVGGVLAVLCFVSLKSLFYTVPLSLAILAFPRTGGKTLRKQLAFAWVAGVLALFALVRVLFAVTGRQPVFGGFNFESVGEFADAIAGLPRQVPLLLALAIPGLIIEIAGARRLGKKALTWEGNLPEAMLFLGALAALLVNPARSPADLLNLVPYAFLLAFRYASLLVKDMRQNTSLIPAFIAVIVFVHLVPFGMAVRGYLAANNFRQENLMRLAEDITDPAKDSIFDRVGLVPTRINTGRGELFTHPPAVFIPNRRTEWISDEDKAFLREHYVKMAEDFHVLGRVLPAGGGAFEIIHPGRYRISSLETSDIVGTYAEGWDAVGKPEEKSTLTGTVDGRPFADSPVELAVGKHLVETGEKRPVAIVWVGPNRARLHRLGEGDQRRLFY